MINFYAPMNNLGYGIHSFNLLKALDKQGVDISLFPPNNRVDLENSLVEKWLANQSKFSSKDIGVMIFHEQFMNRFSGSKRIGFPVFELSLTSVDIEKLRTLDYILQTSGWFTSYLNSLGFENVRTIPEGFDETIYDFSKFGLAQKLELLNKEGIVFSTVGKFEERKSSRDILKIFTYALDGHYAKCTLIAHMYNMFDQSWLEQTTNFLISLGYSVSNEDEGSRNFIKNNLRIMVLKGLVKDIKSIYDNSHFGIYIPKAEGWCLPLIESIASGVPCIATNWTGQTEYLKEYPLDLLVNEGSETVAFDGKWFLGDRGNWMVPDLSSVKSKLRYIANEPEKYLKMNKMCYDSVKEFTWTNSANKFLQFTKEVGINV